MADGLKERSINGVEMPRRIWLTDEGSGDVCWANDPDPSGDRQAEAVEYVRADHITQLEAEVERLAEALAPFAKAADVKLCGEWRDDQHFGQTDVGFYLTFGDLRHARAALTGENKPR